MKLCIIGLHKWKPHYVQVKNVRQHKEMEALAGDAFLTFCCGMRPILSLLVPYCGFPNGPGMVQSGYRCTTCGKRR